MCPIYPCAPCAHAPHAAHAGALSLSRAIASCHALSHPPMQHMHPCNTCAPCRYIESFQSTGQLSRSFTSTYAPVHTKTTRLLVRMDRNPKKKVRMGAWAQATTGNLVCIPQPRLSVEPELKTIGQTCKSHFVLHSWSHSVLHPWSRSVPRLWSHSLSLVTLCTPGHTLCLTPGHIFHPTPGHTLRGTSGCTPHWEI